MRRPLGTTLVAISAAAALALLEVFRTSVSRVIEGDTTTFYIVLHRIIPMWITVIFASPWCAFMAWRFPFRPGRTVATLLAHLGGAAVFTAIHMLLLLGFHAVRSDHQFPAVPMLFHTYAFYVAMEMSVYFAIVIVLLFLEARREATEREVAKVRLEQSVTTARLESLQAQLRPHFLFNTLNALAVLARRGDGPAVDRAIGDLGDLLRASFEAPAGEQVALDDELKFVERYVALQRIRFPDRLDVEWDVEEEARRVRVPVLLLQPLVENAIEHGLASARGGRVRIAARRSGDALEIEVTDEGPGFTAATNAGRGVGLANTRERLALLYGQRGVLECGDLPGGGGQVRVRVPWTMSSAPEAELA